MIHWQCPTCRDIFTDLTISHGCPIPKKDGNIIFFTDSWLTDQKFEVTSHEDHKIFLHHPHDHKRSTDWKHIFKLLKRNSDLNILESTIDLGAGTGTLGKFLQTKNSKIEIINEEINLSYLRSSLTTTHTTGIVHDINMVLPFPDNTFDLASCIGTWHYSYVPSLLPVFQELIRVSRHYILVDFFVKHSLWSLAERIYAPKYHPKRFSKAELTALFRSLPVHIIDYRISRTPPFYHRSYLLGKTLFILLEKKYASHLSSL